MLLHKCATNAWPVSRGPSPSAFTASRAMRTTVAPRAQPENNSPSPAGGDQSSYRREFKSLGSQVIETDEAFEQPPDKDIWDDPKFEALGQFGEKYFLPTLVVLGLVCGGIAAASYNSGADTYIKAAGPGEENVRVVPAQQPPPQ